MVAWLTLDGRRERKELVLAYLAAFSISIRNTTSANRATGIEDVLTHTGAISSRHWSDRLTSTEQEGHPSMAIFRPLEDPDAVR